MNTLIEYIKLGMRQTEKGIAKYGGTLDDKELSPVELIDHAVEEHADAIFYLLKLKDKLNGKPSCGTCKHHLVKVTERPCSNCSAEIYDMWEPEKEGTE